MWWAYLQNHQQKEDAWWSNGRFRMKHSCDDQTIVLRSSWASSTGMVSICFPCAQRKLEHKEQEQGFCLMWENNSLLTDPSGLPLLTGLPSNCKLLLTLSFYDTWCLIIFGAIFGSSLNPQTPQCLFVVWNWILHSHPQLGSPTGSRPPGQLRGAEWKSFIMLLNEVSDRSRPEPWKS